MRTRAVSLFVVCQLAGLAFAASAKDFCFFDSFGFRWKVDRRSGTGTVNLGPRCGAGDNIWSVSGTITKTGRKQYDVDLTATNPFECPAECEDSFDVSGHFSRKNGSGTWSADVYEECGNAGGGTVELPLTLKKHRCD
jgi:hypothetical protein